MKTFVLTTSSRQKKNGFTFIEVLVVTTIIAVLTAVGVTNFQVANQKSRDGRRKGDVEQIKAALELYRTDQGDYPTTAEWPGAEGTLAAGGMTYMSSVPDDPTEDYDYDYESDGLTYKVCASLEVDTTGSCTIAGGGDCGEGDCNYQVTNPL